MATTPPLLTSRQLAASLGVSESSIKRWVNDGTIAADRTPGGHRRIPLSAAVGFIRRQRAAVVKTGVLPLPIAPHVGPVDAHASALLYEAFLKDRSLDARAIITGRYLGGASIAAIADDLIRPVMQRLGELWHHDPEGLLLEHRAVDSCLRAMSEIDAWLPPLPASAPAAVTAGGPQDPYLLSPMLACMVLRTSGIRAHNLGPFTPLETVSLAMARYDSRLCSISISAELPPRTEAAWAELANQTEKLAGRMVIGGRCCGSLPAKIRDRVLVCDSMAELGAFATGWLAGIGHAKPDNKGVSR